MAKKHRNNAAVEHGRGVINDNAIKALVTSPMFSMRVVKAKKGKGAYQRYKKGQDYNDSALFLCSSRHPTNANKNHACVTVTAQFRPACFA